MEEKEVIDLLKANLPIAVCDGSKINRDAVFALHMIHWLRNKGFDYQPEGSLYARSDYDLSKYRTIAFDTQAERNREEDFLKIVNSFPHDNLKVIIVGNEDAYRKIKVLAEKLGITVIFFDAWTACGLYEWAKEEKAEEFYTLVDFYNAAHDDLFFDAKEKFKDEAE